MASEGMEGPPRSNGGGVLLNSNALPRLRSSVLDEVVSLGSDAAALDRALREAIAEEAAVKAEIAKTLQCSEGGDPSIDEDNKRGVLTTDFMESLERAMEGMAAGLPSLDFVMEGASQLESRISETREMADVVSKRVREIDLARGRALDALGKVKQLLELRRCVKGVKESMAQNALEDASDFIHRYRKSQVDTTGELAEGDAMVNEDFVACEEAVRTAALQELDQAIEEKVDSNVVQACRILAKLGHAREAAMRLVEFRCERLRKDVQLETELTIAQVESSSSSFEYGAQTSEENGSEEQQKTFLDLLIYLINQGAASIQKTASVVKRNISKDVSLQRLVVSTIHIECDKLITNILRMFLEKYHIQDKVRMVRKDHGKLGEAMALGSQTWSFSASSSPSDALTSLCALLDDMALTLTHTETYNAFILSKHMELDDPTNTTIADEVSIKDNRSRFHSEYIDVVQEVAGYYAILEEVYMHVALKVAIEQEMPFNRLSVASEAEVQTESGSPAGGSAELESSLSNKQVVVSSIAEDSFFVIKQSMDRAKTTSHIESACAVVNNTVKLLEDVLGGLLQSRVLGIRETTNSLSMQGQEQLDKLRAAAYSQAQAFSGTASPSRPGSSAGRKGTGGHGMEDGDDVDMLKSAETILNSVSLCIINTNKLRVDLDQYAEGMDDEHKRVMLKNCADSLMETVEVFRRSQSTGLDRVSSAAKVRIRDQLDASLGSSTVRYELTFEEYNALSHGVGDVFVLPLLKLTDELIEELTRRLDVPSAKRVSQHLALFVAKSMEHALVRKKFTQFGALLLDKQLRDVAKFFDGRCGSQTRQVFKRLQQITDLLNLDRVEDVHDVYMESTSGLASKEVKRVLALRGDFKNDDIKRLKI